ncbi:MAG TPA: hypothetical protein VGD87_01185, partial [Archangium sp.]
TTPQPPALPPPPPPVKVPEGCLAPLGGDWVHASDPSYRYVGEDDGGTLTLFVTHEFAADAGFSPRRFRDAGVPAAGDAGAADAGVADGGAPREVGVNDAGLASPLPAPSGRTRVELQRTGAGFVGATHALVTHPSGRQCEAKFATTVLSCADGGLILDTQSATALGDACQAPARPLEQLTLQHPLVRPDAGP